MASYLASCVCLVAKSKGKPDAGNPLVRFDEGEGVPLPTLPGDIFLYNLTFSV